MIKDILMAQMINDAAGVVRLYKKDGVTDQDDLKLKYSLMVAGPKLTRNYMIFLAILSVPMLFVFVGIIMLPIALWVMRKQTKRIKMINNGTDLYCKEMGIPSPVA